jgi:hypothetical protein
MSDHDELLARADANSADNMRRGPLVRELAVALRAALATQPQPLAIIRSIIAEAEVFHAEDHPVLGDEWFLSRLRLAAEAAAGSATPDKDDDG